MLGWKWEPHREGEREGNRDSLSEADENTIEEKKIAGNERKKWNYKFL